MASSKEIVNISERRLLVEFLEAYKDFPCLWDMSDRHYANKDARDQAYQFILERWKTGHPSATIEDIKKKIDNLRTAYRRERKKVESSKSTGAGTQDVYNPSLWYYPYLSFLNEKTIPTSQGIDNLTETTDENNEEPAKKEKSAIKRQNSLYKKQEKLIESATQLIKESSSHEDSSADAFGRSVSSQLKELPKLQRCIVEKMIGEILFYAKLGELSLDTSINLNKNIHTVSQSCHTPHRSHLLPFSPYPQQPSRNNHTQSSPSPNYSTPTPSPQHSQTLSSTFSYPQPSPPITHTQSSPYPNYSTPTPSPQHSQKLSSTFSYPQPSPPITHTQSSPYPNYSTPTPSPQHSQTLSSTFSYLQPSPPITHTQSSPYPNYSTPTPSPQYSQTLSSTFSYPQPSPPITHTQSTPLPNYTKPTLFLPQTPADSITIYPADPHSQYTPLGQVLLPNDFSNTISITNDHTMTLPELIPSGVPNTNVSESSSSKMKLAIFSGTSKDLEEFLILKR